MSDLNTPLRPRGARPPGEGSPGKGPFEKGPLERRALDMSFKKRSAGARWLGVALIVVGMAGAWWYSKERRGEPAIEPVATASVTTAPVTAAIGPPVDERTPKLPRIDEGIEDVVLLDRDPEPFETLGEEPVAAPVDRHPVHLPRPELLEDAPEGPLPRIANGLTPFEAYRVRKPTVAAARVAIVIGGLGLSQTGTKQAIDRLPADVTLAFSPDGNSLRRWTEAARKDGHEIALQVPLEPIGWPEVRPSERTVTRADPSSEAIAASLGRITTYPVVANYLGTAFSLDAEALTAFMRELKGRGLGYVDDGRSEAGRAAAVARAVGLPFAQGSVLLDEERGAAAVDRALDRLVERAKTKGWAIASGTAFPTTVERVALFVEQAKAKGVTIVPLTNLMRRP